MTSRRVSLRFLEDVDDDILFYLSQHKNTSACIKKAIRAGMFYFQNISSLTPPTLPNGVNIQPMQRTPITEQNMNNDDTLNIDTNNELMQNLIKTTNNF